MKKFIQTLPALLAVMVLFSACGEVEPPTPTAATISLSTDVGFVSDTATVNIGEVFNVKVITSRGSSSIKTVGITENGSAVAIDRITLDGDPAGSNPTPIDPSLGSGFTWDIGITAHSEADVTSTYEIAITDSSGLTSTVSVDITAVDPGTPADDFMGYLLLNQGGPTGTGGLDLDTGNGTGSADPESEIRDQGIDLGAPSNDLNWIQKIAPIVDNGAEMRTPAAEFDYDATTKKEEIAAAFAAGTELVGGETEKVAIGDVFLVKRGDNYYVIRTVDISVTPDDNDDYYEFEGKR